MKKAYKFLILTSFLLFLFELVYAEQYCIYQRDYNQWLCNNIRGAERACYAPDYNGNFPDFSSCESARKNALPYDTYWQSMTKCVPCGTPSHRSSPEPSYRTSPRASSYRKLKAMAESYRMELLQKFGEEAAKEFNYCISPFCSADPLSCIDLCFNSLYDSYEKKAYLKVMEQEKIQKKSEFRKMVSELSRQLKTSPPPMNSIEKEHYKKALKQAYCIAYTSIKAAEMALKGNFEISNQLLTNIENARITAGAVFDTSGQPLSSCPDINFEIPDVRMSIEKDPRYMRYMEITKNIQALIPKIEENSKELQMVQEKKIQAEKDIKETEAKIEELKKDKVKVKTQKEREEYNALLAKALALKEQAEKEYQDALQKEQELQKEKQEIENKLEDMKNKMLAEEKR